MTASAPGDRLRLENPVRGSSGRERPLYSAPSSPHCPNTGPRPGWLLDKWHCAQDHQLDQRYGLRCEGYWLLYERQGGRCALCWYGPRRYRLVPHHDHDTGEVLCLLHFPCNRVIDLLVWLLPRLVALMVDPPGRGLGLRVPAAKLARLEARDRAKRARVKERAKEERNRGERRNGNGPGSNLARIKQLTRGG